MTACSSRTRSTCYGDRLRDVRDQRDAFALPRLCDQSRSLSSADAHAQRERASPGRSWASSSSPGRASARGSSRCPCSSSSRAERRATGGRGAALATLCAAVVLCATVARNGVVAGRFVLGTNAYYNLYIGNDADYEEDLNLFHPAATPAQIAYRVRYHAGAPARRDAGLSDEERLSRASENIRRDPLLFARRATGRLARLFAPKTDELELLGGEVARPRGHPSPPQRSSRSRTSNGGSGCRSWSLWDRVRRRSSMAPLLEGRDAEPVRRDPALPRRGSRSRDTRFPLEPLFLILAIHFLRDLPASFRDVWARHRAIAVAGCLAFSWAWGGVGGSSR